jgi:hypothetical protein
MDMYSCPKWDGCSVPICPPDPDWKSRKILEGERVRFYLTEHSKLPARPTEGRMKKAAPKKDGPINPGVAAPKEVCCGHKIHYTPTT